MLESILGFESETAPDEAGGGGKKPAPGRDSDDYQDLDNSLLASLYLSLHAPAHVRDTACIGACERASADDMRLSGSRDTWENPVPGWPIVSRARKENRVVARVRAGYVR